jgi:LacI family transcriptional regulator
VDNQAIGRLATTHLLLGGARQVGIITGPLDWAEAQSRELGWRETLAVQGLPIEERLRVVGDWRPHSGEAGLYQLLAQNPNLDAVFASNDQMALGALHAAHRLGRKVPDDLAIVGVDNSPGSAHYWPPLTTIRQGLKEAGALSVRVLDGLITKANESNTSYERPAPSRTLLQPELIIRESTRAVKQ